MDASVLAALVSKPIETEPSARLEYVDVVDPSSLLTLDHHLDRAGGGGEALVLVAAWFGEVRLIDNLLLRGPAPTR